MTTIQEVRLDHQGNPYTVCVPIRKAAPSAYDKFLATEVREWLFRQGCNVAHVPDETLLRQVRNTFQSTRSRDGITVAHAVESPV